MRDTAIMFKFLHNGVLIGHSKPEFGDAPMGVAFGRFLPVEAFSVVREKPVLWSEGGDPELRAWDGMSVLTHEDQEIECILGGVVVIEYGCKENPIALEAKCHGISCPRYERLFPHHVKDYEEQFKSK